MTSKERYKKWYLANKEKVREYNKNYRKTKKFKEKEKEYLAKYHKTEKYRIAVALREQTKKYKDFRIKGAKNQREKNTTKVMARVKLQQYIRLNNIKRPPCQLCGEIKTESHHPDYNKPFKVYCLCKHCHRIAHSKPNILNLLKIINYKNL